MKTLKTCYLGYITQAIIVNLAPILFIVFQNQYNITYEKLGRLILINFGVQIVADVIALRTTDRVGYRKAGVAAHFLCAIGLVCLAVLPQMIDPYMGLMISVAIYAFGGGVIEVIISPIVDALPSGAKASSMSLLHSFYCWGQMAVVLFTTVALRIVGAEVWFFLPAAWAIIPFYNLVRFMRVPMPETVRGHEKTPLRRLLGSGIFPVALVLMMCAGASEITMSQWSSLFAEKGLGVSKLLGDLAGPFLFAFLMGAGRTAYGVWGHKIRIKNALLYSGIFCIICYAVVVFVRNPVISLLGCAACGLSICLMWPGTISLTSEYFPKGGTAMFGMLAVFGDVGASLGPWAAGVVSDKAGLRTGLFTAMVFPVLLVVGILMLKRTPADAGKADGHR
jgi:fucose permease